MVTATINPEDARKEIAVLKAQVDAERAYQREQARLIRMMNRRARSVEFRRERVAKEIVRNPQLRGFVRALSEVVDNRTAVYEIYDGGSLPYAEIRLAHGEITLYFSYRQNADEENLERDLDNFFEFHPFTEGLEEAQCVELRTKAFAYTKTYRREQIEFFAKKAEEKAKRKGEKKWAQ